MSEYTPTTDEVIAAYVIGEHLTNPAFPVAETEACFRNWLSAELARVALPAQEAATEVEWGVGYRADDVERHESEDVAREVVANWIAALGFDDGWTVFRRTMTEWQEVPADE